MLMSLQIPLQRAVGLGTVAATAAGRCCCRVLLQALPCRPYAASRWILDMPVPLQGVPRGAASGRRCRVRCTPWSGHAGVAGWCCRRARAA